MLRIWLCLRCYAAESFLEMFSPHSDVVARVLQEIFSTFSVVFLVVFIMLLLYVVAIVF